MLLDSQKPLPGERYDALLPDRSLTLLTGATGTLGQELLYQLLAARPDSHFLVLARGSSKKQSGGAARRVKAMLRQHMSSQQLEETWKQVTVLDGDIGEEQLGLTQGLYSEVVERLEQVIHCAAAVRFDQPLDEAREINLHGTRRVLELARLARRKGREVRFDYVGTAYVAGKRRDVVYENELEHHRGFHNSYEQSKYESEQMVRRHRQELPVTIYRPSIIIGNSRTGETSNFKAFYWPLRVYAMGQMRVLPGAANCRIDLVPVDFVASAVVELSQRAESQDRCFHLTAGRNNVIALREIMEAAVSFFQIKPPTLIHPLLLKPAESWLGRTLLSEHSFKTLKLGKPYYPYFALKLEFDNQQAAQALAPAGIVAPSPHDFFDRLFRYCLESDWGRKHPGGSAHTTEQAEPVSGLGSQVAGAI